MQESVNETPNFQAVVTATLRETTVRGALRITVDTSKSIVRAGEAFSVFVTIENPFDIPIVVQSTQTHLPIALRDLYGEYLIRESRGKTRAEFVGKLESKLQQLAAWLRYFWHDFISALSHHPIPQIAEAYTTKEGASFSPREFVSQVITAQHESSISEVVMVASDVLVTLDPSIPPSEFSKYVHAISSIQHTLQSSDTIILRPNSSIVKQFLFKTRNWLFFVPFRHRMIIQVSYLVEDTLNYDTVPYDLDIRASFVATILGGAIGGFLGAIIRSPDTTTLISATNLLPAIVSAVLAIITVIAFARKSDAQPLVSIEDFLGGFLLGFVVGYTGNALFEQAIQNIGTS